MGILFFGISIVLIMIVVLALFDKEYVISLIVGFLTAIFLYVMPFGILNSDVNTIIHGNEYIQMEQEYANSLREKIDNLPDADSALMNADTPVATMVENLHAAENRIRERRVDILDAKRNIAERRVGMTSYIFWFYDSDTLKKIK